MNPATWLADRVYAALARALDNLGRRLNLDAYLQRETRRIMALADVASREDDLEVPSDEDIAAMHAAIDAHLRAEAEGRGGPS